MSYKGQENIINSKWVIKIKYKANGIVERRMKILVTIEFQQTIGLDFEETTSLVVKVNTV